MLHKQPKKGLRNYLRFFFPYYATNLAASKSVRYKSRYLSLKQMYLIIILCAQLPKCMRYMFVFNYTLIMSTVSSQQEMSGFDSHSFSACGLHIFSVPARFPFGCITSSSLQLGLNCGYRRQRCVGHLFCFVLFCCLKLWLQTSGEETQHFRRFL